MSSTRHTTVIASNYGKVPDKNAVALALFIVANTHYRLIIIGSKGLSDWPAEVTIAAEFIRRGSLKSFWALRVANSVYYTHSLSDAFPYAHRIPLIRHWSRAKMIFLQHGVIGLKKILANGTTLSNYICSLEPTFDLMVVSSESERKLVTNFGVPRSKLVVSGLPRFDLYAHFPFTGKPDQALVFLTWADPQKICAKIKDITLAANSAGVDITIRNHPMMTTQNEELDLSAYSLLITDDSSLAWDFFFIDKTVIFYQPSEWLGSQSKFEHLIANDTAHLDHLLISHKNQQLPKMQSDHFFFKQDNHNSKRIFEATEHLWNTTQQR